MDANQVLVETIRGNWVENRHRGAIAVCDSAGNLVLAMGDVARPVFPRSAIKSMQALALVTSGALQRFSLSDEELALACASHHGEPGHIAGVERFLAHLGLSAGDLECGGHPPTNAAARDALRRTGEQPSALYNNCSGKHSGMLADALAMGVPTTGYIERDHPVQVAVRAAVETVIGTPLSTDRCGTDGCSIPTWAAPLTAFATGFARMATGQGLPPDLAAGARRICDAATAHPELVAGTGHLDTEVMQAFAGRLMQKGGAEGVQCGAIRDLGLGYALKIDDGSMAASHVAVAALLLAVARPSDAERAVLERFARHPIRNVRGTLVGEMRATEALSSPRSR